MRATMCFMAGRRLVELWREDGSEALLCTLACSDRCMPCAWWQVAGPVLVWPGGWVMALSFFPALLVLEVLNNSSFRL